MDARQETIKKIKNLLRYHRKGLTITDIAQKLHLNRNSTAKYLEILLISGEVILNTYGPAKVYTVSQKMPISAMLKFSADIILLVDNEMRVLDANENALSILGMSREDLVGNLIENVNSPLIARLASPDVFEEIEKTGEIQREFSITRQNEDHHYRVRIIPTVFDNREDGVTIIGEDITKQIRFEESLMISEARYRAIVQDHSDFICRWRPEGEITFINDTLGGFIGISCSAAEGESIFSYIFPEDIPLAKEKISQLNSNQPSMSTELRVRDKEGQYRWLQWHTRCIYDNAGTPVECQSVGRDTTERKRAEEALLHLSDRLLLATRAGGVGIWDLDLVNNILTWDDQMFALHGIPKEQFCGAYETWKAGIIPEDLQKADAEVQMALNGEKEFNTEFRVLWPDGSIHNIRAIALVQRDASGKPLRMIGTNWDITAQKKAEDALKERFKELNCLYGISALLESPGISLDEILKRTVMLIPPAWHFPEITAACIVLEGQIFQTARFRETPWMLTREIIVNGNPVGQLEVCYLEERQASDEGPFMIDERHLLNAIAERLGRIIERKRAEKALHESEERYRSVVEDQTEFICRFTPAGILTFVNDAYCRYFGLDKGKCIGIPHSVILPHEDARLVRKHLASLSLENPVGIIKHRIQMPDGKIMWQRWTDRAIFNNEGQVIEYQSVGRDITTKQEQMQKIRESEERFHMITNLSPFPISIIDDSGNYQYVNKMFTQLFGYTLAEIPTGKDWFLKAFPDSTERSKAMLTWKNDLAHSITGEVRPRVFPITCKDGTVRQINFFPVTLQSGEQFVVYEDLTLKNESERLRSVLAAIVNSSNDAIIAKDLDGTIISWNKAAERIYGYLAEEVIGKSITVIIAPELRDQLPLFLKRIRAGECIEHFKTTRMHKDGTYIEVSITISPIKDEQGQIVGISTIAKNISDFKKS